MCAHLSSFPLPADRETLEPTDGRWLRHHQPRCQNECMEKTLHTHTHTDDTHTDLTHTHTYTHQSHTQHHQQHYQLGNI